MTVTPLKTPQTPAATMIRFARNWRRRLKLRAKHARLSSAASWRSNRICSSIAAAKKAVQAAEAGVAKAARDYASALANAAANDAPPPASGVAVARQAVVEAQDAVAAHEGALAELKAQIPDWEADAREKEIAAAAAVNAVLAPHIGQLLDKAQAIQREMIPIVQTLFAYFNAPKSSDPIAAGREGKPLAEIEDAVGKFFANYGYIPEPETANPWQGARERLREDPHAALLDFASPPPNAE